MPKLTREPGIRWVLTRAGRRPAGSIDRRRQLALTVVCLSATVVGLDSLIVNVALPTLVRELQASTSELQWIVDSYLLVYAGLLLTGGSLGDRFGRALVLRVGLLIFGFASVGAAYSADATALVLCRGLMGVGAALIMPASVAVVSNMYVEPRERRRALGVWAAFGGFGLALGPVLGGVLLSQFGWASIFLVNVPIVLIALVVGWWVVPESRNPIAGRFDPLGVLLSVLAVSTLVWATIDAPSHGWLSTSTLISFAVALGFLGCFVCWELRCAYPMLELTFFADQRFSVANFAAAASGFAFAGSLFVLTQLLQFVFGYSPLVAGVGLLPMAVVFVSAGWFGARLAEFMGTRRAVAAGLLICALGLSILGTTSQQTGYERVLLAMLAIGGGFALTVAPITDAVMGTVPREKAGVASGTLNTTKQMGNAVGVAVIGSILVSGYQASLGGRVEALGLSRSELVQTRASVGSALRVARRLGDRPGDALTESAQHAFAHGLRLGMAVGVVILIVASALSLRYLPTRADDRSSDGSIEILG